MTVRAKEIAEYVGVSAPVVSKVLHGGKSNVGVSERTRQRVLEAADQLGYRANTWARAVSTGKRNTVGYVTFTKEFPAGDYISSGSHMVVGIVCKALADRDFHLTYSLIREDDLDSPRLPAVIREAMCDALLVDCSGLLPERLVEVLGKYNIPFVAVNARATHDCVHPGDEDGGYAATRILLERGHRRIAMVGPAQWDLFADHYSIADREAGYARAMSEAGLDTCTVRPPVLHSRHGDSDPAAFRELLRGPDRVTAIVCYGPGQAEQAYVEAIRAGLEVPRDLSLIVLLRSQHIDMVRFAGKTFDCMKVRESEVGQAAAEMVLAKCQSPMTPLDPVVIPFSHIEAQSLAPGPFA